jgi:hypothetical protein
MMGDRRTWGELAMVEGIIERVLNKALNIGRLTKENRRQAKKKE